MAKRKQKSRRKDTTSPALSENQLKVTTNKAAKKTVEISQTDDLVRADGGAGDCPDNKFSYSFATTNASVLSIQVEGFKKNTPGDSDDFTTCINDATDEPK